MDNFQRSTVRTRPPQWIKTGTLRPAISAAVACVLLVGIASGPALHAADDQTAVAILQKHCGACHDKTNPNRLDDYEGDFTSAASAAEMVKGKWIIPGSVNESPVMDRISDGTMPPPGDEPAGRPTAEELKTLEKWVVALEKKSEERERISLLQEFQAMETWLRQLPVEVQPRTRFFSLRQLHNNPNVGQRDLEMARLALAKSLNSLSWQRSLVSIQKVGETRTLYAIDLERVSWDSNDWQSMVARYPYALRYDTSPLNQDLNQTAEDVYDRTGSFVPVLRVDWFVAMATRPPLYHRLLDIPKTEKELERHLGVDVERNIVNATAIRSGTQKSGISAQNRLLERHDNGRYGFYWKSYDFKPEQEAKRSNLSNFPLGPAFPSNPYNELAFAHDGGEFIFQLPNGLQGYMLVDGKGGRIDSGPQDVVEDRTGRFSGSALILNGVSCMGCHGDGMINPQPDDVVAFSPLRGDPAKLMRRLYPGDKELNSYIEQDREDFRRAVLRAYKTIAAPDTVLSSTNPDGSQGPPVEPVGGIAKQFIAEPIDLIDFAVELDYEKPERLAGAIEANDRLTALGLGPLANDRVLRRPSLEVRTGLSTRFQRAAMLLDRGTPYVIHAPDD